MQEVSIRKAWLIGVIVLVLSGAGLVYAWGEGAFWPCEPLGRLFSGDRCTKVAQLDGRSIRAVAGLPNGNLLVAAAPARQGSDDVPALLEMQVADGRIVDEVPLPFIDAEDSISKMVLNADASLVALSQFREPTAIVDRAGSVVANIDRYLPAYMAFSGQNEFLVEMGSNPDQMPLIEAASIFPIGPNGGSERVASVAETGALFAQGVNAVVDGTHELYAQRIDRIGDSDVAGIRLGYVDNPSNPGLLLPAPLRADCSYATSSLAFSPDSTKLAATFSCTHRWGQVSTALFVWDFVEGKTLARVPSNDWWAPPLWLDDNTLVLERSADNGTKSELFTYSLI